MTSKLTRNYLPEMLAIGYRRSKPSMVTVNLTSRCNQQCIYCEIGKDLPSGDKNYLSTTDLEWIIDQMEKSGIRKISLCGGEPFLFGGLTDVVAYAGKKNIRCSVTTNGMTAYMLNETRLDVLKKFKTEVNVSIDSFTEAVQSFTRGTPSALRNALRSIQRLSEKSIPVTVLTVISKYNYRDLFEFVTIAHQKGIRQVLFQPVICYSNYPDRPPVGNKPQMNVGAGEIEILMAELRKILRFERTHRIKTNVYRIFPWIGHYLTTAASLNGNWFFSGLLKKFYCREIDAIIDITYDGGIQPCGLALAEVTIHAERHLGLMALWVRATSGIRDDLLNGRYRPYCNGCCHHFSRNMLASVMKYPFKNKDALFDLLPLMVLRILSAGMKKLFL
jgi:MoaA/NifB/PqqE/SkfB family radical SAM enzyme